MINSERHQAKATIAWLTPEDAGPEPRVLLAAEDAGYLVATGPDAEKSDCDVVIADLRGFHQSTPAVSELISRARALGPSAGIIIAASASADRKMRSLLRRHGDVRHLGRDAAPLIASVRERLRLFMLADEMGERMKSLIADGRTASFSGFGERRDRFSVLVAGAASPLTLNVCNSVNRVAAHTSCVFTAGQVMRALDHYRFDCAVFLPTGETDLLIALARALRRHRDHRKLPVFIASEDDELLDRCAGKEGFDVIMAQHLEADIAPRLGVAVRRARMAAMMRAFLRSSDGCGGGGEGAAAARFFAHHATRIFNHAEAAGKAVSLVGLSLEPRTGSGANDATSAALSEALRTTTRLVRAEDLITRLTPTTLVVLLRGVNAREAERIADRLEGVIGGSLTRSTCDIACVSAASVQRAGGEGLEHVVATLLRSLQVRKARTATAG